MDNFNKKWKAIPCGSGEECWCRCIVTDDYSDDEPREISDDEYIVAFGAIDKETAEYFVNLHNKEIVK